MEQAGRVFAEDVLEVDAVVVVHEQVQAPHPTAHAAPRRGPQLDDEEGLQAEGDPERVHLVGGERVDGVLEDDEEEGQEQDDGAAHLRVRREAKEDEETDLEGDARIARDLDILQLHHGARCLRTQELGVMIEMQKNESPQHFNTIAEMRHLLLLVEADPGNSVRDRHSALKITVLVVLLEDLVNGGAIQSAVVVEVLQHPVQLLQTEFELPVLGTRRGKLLPVIAQFAKVIHLHVTSTSLNDLLHIVVVTNGALHLLLHIPLVDHLDFIKQFLKERLLLLCAFLHCYGQRTNRTAGITHCQQMEPSSFSHSL